MATCMEAFCRNPGPFVLTDSLRVPKTLLFVDFCFLLCIPNISGGPVKPFVSRYSPGNSASPCLECSKNERSASLCINGKKKKIISCALLSLSYFLL